MMRRSLLGDVQIDDGVMISGKGVVRTGDLRDTLCRKYSSQIEKRDELQEIT